MLETIFGNPTAALALLFLERKGKVYPTELAKGLDIPLNMVQKQLERFERGGVLKSSKEGKKRLYHWNADHPLTRPLRDILGRANALGPTEDPADGTYLTYEERLELAENLWNEGIRLNRSKPKDTAHKLARSFDTFEAYHAWQKAQKIS